MKLREWRRSEPGMLRFQNGRACSDCQIVELRALCNEVPRTPPGPEGSNGTGSTECAAEIPKFLDLDEEDTRHQRSAIRYQRSVSSSARLEYRFHVKSLN